MKQKQLVTDPETGAVIVERGQQTMDQQLEGVKPGLTNKSTITPPQTAFTGIDREAATPAPQQIQARKNQLQQNQQQQQIPQFPAVPQPLSLLETGAPQIPPTPEISIPKEITIEQLNVQEPSLPSAVQTTKAFTEPLAKRTNETIQTANLSLKALQQAQSQLAQNEAIQARINRNNALNELFNAPDVSLLNKRQELMELLGVNAQRNITNEAINEITKVKEEMAQAINSLNFEGTGSLRSRRAAQIAQQAEIRLQSLKFNLEAQQGKLSDLNQRVDTFLNDYKADIANRMNLLDKRLNISNTLDKDAQLNLKRIIEEEKKELQLQQERVEKNAKNVTEFMFKNPALSFKAGVTIDDTPEKIALKVGKYIAENPEQDPGNKVITQNGRKIVVSPTGAIVKDLGAGEMSFEDKLDKIARLGAAFPQLTPNQIIAMVNGGISQDFSNIVSTSLPPAPQNNFASVTARKQNPFLIDVETARKAGLVEGVDFKGGKIGSGSPPQLATRNNNPGNLRFNNQPGATLGEGNFARFATPQAGFNALISDLNGKLSGRTRTGLTPNSTLFDLISVYAPAADKNNPEVYANDIAKKLNVTTDTKLKDLQSRVVDLAEAIASHEDGANYNLLAEKGIVSGKFSTSKPLPAGSVVPVAFSGDPVQTTIKVLSSDAFWISGNQAVTFLKELGINNKQQFQNLPDNEKVEVIKQSYEKMMTSGNSLSQNATVPTSSSSNFDISRDESKRIASQKAAATQGSRSTTLLTNTENTQSNRELAQSILDGTSSIRIQDLPTSERRAVDAELAKLRREIQNSGDTMAIIRSSAGLKPISDTSIQKLQKVTDTLIRTEEIVKKITKEKTGPILGIIRSNNPYDVKAQALKSEIRNLVPGLARGVYSEVGVLTDADVKLYSEGLASLNNPEALNSMLLSGILKNIATSLEQNLKTEAMAKRDVSQFADLIEETKKRAEDAAIKAWSNQPNNTPGKIMKVRRNNEIVLVQVQADGKTLKRINF